MTVMVATLSQLLGLEQRVDEVDHQAHGHEPGERIVEDHASLLRDGRRRRRSQPTARRTPRRQPPRSRQACWMLRAIKCLGPAASAFLTCIKNPAWAPLHARLAVNDGIGIREERTGTIIGIS